MRVGFGPEHSDGAAGGALGLRWKLLTPEVHHLPRGLWPFPVSWKKVDGVLQNDTGANRRPVTSVTWRHSQWGLGSHDHTGLVPENILEVFHKFTTLSLSGHWEHSKECLLYIKFSWLADASIENNLQFIYTAGRFTGAKQLGLMLIGCCLSQISTSPCT